MGRRARNCGERSAKGEDGALRRKNIPPLLNHALIFTTDERSLHGFPGPVTCPEGESRKSLAFVHYTIEEDKKSAAIDRYFARPKMAEKIGMIWLDRRPSICTHRAEIPLRILRRICQQGFGISFGEERVEECFGGFSSVFASLSMFALCELLATALRS